MRPHWRNTRTHALRIVGGILLAVWGATGCGNGSPSAPLSEQLVFQAQPAPVSERQLLAPVVVAIQNADGVPDSSATTAVTLALGENPGGGTLSGTLTVNAVAGFAIFDDLSLDRSGSGYTLVASAGALTDVESAPFDVAFASPLAVGFAHACAVRSGGQAYCWGYNNNGQLGDGTTASRVEPVAVMGKPGGDISFASLSPGAYTTCGLDVTGEAYCWGLNNHGQLGDSTTAQRTAPSLVAGGRVFASISSGADHGCAVEAGTRDTYCWGYNNVGQLGNGTTLDFLAPTLILGSSLFGFDAASAGWAVTCAVTPDGSGYCWGYNNYGQLGNGTILNQYSPTPVLGGLTFQSIQVSSYYTWWDACGVTPEGEAYCWGTNNHGQMGVGSITDYSAAPALVFGGLAFAGVSPGGDHTCGVTTDGDAYCWGRNDHGQLGSGSISTTDDASTPSLVTGGHVFRFVGSGWNFSCGITTDDDVYCWGQNQVGQLGDGTITDSPEPMLVTGLPVGLGG